MKEKMWINCSPQEKRAVKQIERKKGWLDFLYIKKLISKDVWMFEKRKLIYYLNKIEVQYGMD